MIVRLLSITALGSLTVMVSAPFSASDAAGPPGAVQIIQAVPGAAVDVSLDGARVRTGVREGVILGPLTLSAGRHVVTFRSTSANVRMRAAVVVRARSSTDVVLHRPASVSGKPQVNTYATPSKPIGPGKARVLLAHTATVAPADVRLDGRTVFTNIANGEFAQGDVPAGKHRVALLPTGQTTDPILGPIVVDLAPRTVTMVYAVGTPSNGSMRVIAHVERLTADGTVAPDRITTGSAGWGAGLIVREFSMAASGAGGS